jgi:hypothetical protein
VPVRHRRFDTKNFGGAPAIVPIAETTFGSMICLKCTGGDTGAVYFWDGQKRSAWPDAQFRRMYENLAPEIADYLSKR